LRSLAPRITPAPLRSQQGGFEETNQGKGAEQEALPTSPDYGARWRAGQVISTAFIESLVDSLLAKRFAKKQSIGRPKVLTCCYRSASGHSTVIWSRRSAMAIPTSPSLIRLCIGTSSQPDRPHFCYALHGQADHG
jgi:hypothetical protein